MPVHIHDCNFQDLQLQSKARSKMWPSSFCNFYFILCLVFCKGHKTVDNCGSVFRCVPAGNATTGIAPPMRGVAAVAANVTATISAITARASTVLPATTATTPGYSGVTLSQEWPKLERLLFILLCSCVGSTMNGFFVAAFFVEHSLRNVGNVFLACAGMADLILTTTVMPVSAVVILSGEWDTIPVCKALQFFAEMSTYCYSIFFSLVAAETYYRLCRPICEYEMFVSMRVGLVTVLVFVLSVALAAFGVYMGLDYDYCQRLHFGDFYFRMVTGVMFHYIPFIITFSSLIVALIKIHSRARKHLQYKRSQLYERDCSFTWLHISAFCLYVGFWIPYLIVVYEYPATTDKTFYYCAWAGVLRSVITSFMYSCGNRSFRRAFAHLFNYCCCKSSLGYGNARRRRDYSKPATDVRVHIMHSAVNASSPQRAASSSRETQEL